MHMHDHTYPKRWLALGVAALAIAGLFAITLVVGRTPQLKELSWASDLFAVALVVHVDLSVLVWFLSVIGMGLSLAMRRQRALNIPYAEPASWWCMAVGTALMALSPLDGEWQVIKSNYIPVLFNWMFFLGLSLLASGMLILCSLCVIRLNITDALHPPTPERRAANFAWQGLAWMVLMALVMFALSAAYLPVNLPQEKRFEALFWAGGHTLQFAYCLMMMLAWGGLYRASRARALAGPSATWILTGIMLFGAALPFYAFIIYPVGSEGFRDLFTNVMIALGGLAPGYLMLMLGLQLCVHKRKETAPRAAGSVLWMSALLFAIGGVFGLMIQGENVMIPAHYHGSIVAVTIALMGYAMLMMPRFGYAAVAHTRLAFWQPVVYGVGQIMHIGGLAYSGGYGVLRKTAATHGNFAPDVMAALGFMGLGGLLAIIGGLMFVVIMWRGWRS